MSGIRSSRAVAQSETAAARPSSVADVPTYPPTEQFRRDPAGASALHWTPARLGVRIRNDPSLLLAIAIAVPVLAMEAVWGDAEPMFGWLGPFAFVAIQAWLTLLRSAPWWLPDARLALSLGFIAAANTWFDRTGTWPLSALAIPIVALGASQGRRGSLLVAAAGMALILAPLVDPAGDAAARREFLAVAMAALVVAIGSRRVVADLRRTAMRLRRSNQRDRARARQLSAVETVGHLLAREGSSSEALDKVMGLLEGTFGYRYPSVYVWDGQAMQLGAQRNYRNPIVTVPVGSGIIGRAFATREPIFLPDARKDTAFLSGDAEVVSEIAIPLESETELLGVLNIETSGDRRLDLDDFALMQIVGDRLAASLALGRERQKLTERAALLDRLTHFAATLAASLDPATMDDEAAAGAALVVPADMVVVVNRAELTGKFTIYAVAGGDASIVGGVIEPGEGLTGRAIATRTVTVDDHVERARYPRAAAGAKLADVVAGMAAPMIVDGEVFGVVSWVRSDLSRPFSDQEREIGGLLAGRVGLALANARLHQATRHAAMTDPLTGIHNRRHFDATLEREDALRRRIPAEKRGLRSAIMFDLDHFGAVNKRFGHQIGDRVLRLFADTLTARSRASDLVARYGGEEFVVILDNASRDEAVAIAEDVRTAFARLTIDTPGGEPLSSTASAGCATLEPWEVEGSLLLERADVALAMAKAGGRNQVVAA